MNRDKGGKMDQVQLKIIRWRKSFELKILNRLTFNILDMNGTHLESYHSHCQSSMQLEITSSIQKLKSKKTGENGLRVEIFKCSPAFFTSENNIHWYERRIPCDWSKIVFFIIFKKDGRTHCNNYRKISFIRCLDVSGNFLPFFC